MKSLVVSRGCIDYREVYTIEQKWHGPSSFCKETVKFYPFCVGSIRAYGPLTAWIKVHCFFAKTVGTVPVFVGSLPFLLSRVNVPFRFQRLDLKTKKAFGLKKENSIAFSLQCLMRYGNKKKKNYPGGNFLCYTFFCTP